jgi:hypothetical protein
MKRTTLALILFLLGSCAAWAGSVCPAGTNFSHNPDPTGTGCNVIITINASGPVTITIPDSSAYDGSDDMLVGVVNNSSGALSSMALTGTGIFGFELDGICTFTFVGSTSFCTGLRLTTDPYDYAGPTSSFTVTNNSSGTVNFSPSVPASGGTTYFSLEGAPTLSITVIPTTGPTTPTTVPALSTWGFVLLTVLLMGLSVRMLKRA